jgi:site-specific DNA-methyltransferase (adenine-specific)
MNGEHLWLSGVECCVFGRKKGAKFHERCKNSVWRYPTVRGKIHPTQKPVDLFRYLIRTSSDPGDLILDPCIGSGTTAVAALAENRYFLGIERDEAFYRAAVERIGSGLNTT